MSDLSRWRGLKALVQDAVEQGSKAVEKLQVETLARPLSLLEQVPPLAGPVRAVRAVHGASVAGTHLAIRLTTRAVGATLDVVLDALERPSVQPQGEQHVVERVGEHGDPEAPGDHQPGEQ